jgi:signal transduction histidine kinase/ActR/RegA family two-component response regulator
LFPGLFFIVNIAPTCHLSAISILSLLLPRKGIADFLRRCRPGRGQLLQSCVLAALYFLFGQASFQVSVEHRMLTPVFFAPEGIALAAMILFGPGLWPGIVVGQWLLGLNAGLPFGIALAIGLANGFEGLVGSFGFGFLNLRSDLKRLSDLLWLVTLIFLVLQPLSATLGMVALQPGHVSNEPFFITQEWLNWWSGNGIAQAQLTPLLLILFSRRRAWRDNLVDAVLPALIMVEGLSLFVVMTLDGLSLMNNLDLYRPLVVIPGLVRGRLAACFASLYLSIVTLWATSIGEGPFRNSSGINFYGLNLFVITSGLVALIVATLIEQIKESEQQALKSGAAARQALTENQNLISRMSHEIRTPLAAIRNHADQAMATQIDHDSHSRYGAILSASQHALDVVNDLLDPERPKGELANIRLEPVAVREMTNILYQILVPMFERKGLNFLVDIDDDVPGYILTDPMKLKQVILNLLSNAGKFTSQGTIRFHWSLVPPGAADAKTLRIAVEDTGPGLDANEIASLFRPFRRLDNVHNSEEEGTGLGLFISRDIVQTLGGQLLVDSQRGRGSCFFILLPLRVPENVVLAQSGFNSDFDVPTQVCAISSPDQQVPRLAGLRLLLAEDYPSLRHCLQEILEIHGATVFAAASGEEALALMAINPIEMVLMDMTMPGISGLETARRIRQDHRPDHRYNQLPIIGMTGDVFLESEKAFLEAGINFLLIKPVDTEELLDTLSHFRHRHLAPGPTLPRTPPI